MSQLADQIFIEQGNNSRVDTAGEEDVQIGEPYGIENHPYQDIVGDINRFTKAQS